MGVVAECRKRAQVTLAQAERDPRHSRKLIATAEAWLAFASCLRRLEKSSQLGPSLPASVGRLFYADRK
jgi:hypothetical protein